MSTFENLAIAFQVARSRAQIARDAERRLLHRAIAYAHESEMTIRETASMLRAPVSTVASHWREGHNCPYIPPVWGNADEYRQAERDIWKHAPQLAENTVPYRWFERPDGARDVEPRA